MDTDFDDVYRAARQLREPNRVRLRPPTARERFEHRSAGGGDLAERYHEATKPVAGGDLAGPVAADEPAADGPAGRDYPGRPTVPLPDPPPESEADRAPGAGERPSFSGAAVGVEDLARVACAGPAADEESAGIPAVDVYLLARRVDGLPSGCYYYAPAAHDLRRLARLDGDDLAAAVGATVDPARDDDPGFAASFVLTGVFPRAKRTAGLRGYRHVLQESGRVAERLLSAAESLGLAAAATRDFDDRALNDCLGVDGVDEAALLTVAVGDA